MTSDLADRRSCRSAPLLLQPVSYLPLPGRADRENNALQVCTPNPGCIAGLSKLQPQCVVYHADSLGAAKGLALAFRVCRK